ncbi:hypothetical protein ACH5RR_024293 [Cinchona calisaya]|uniref:Uncharacterized protein n=1 Tax=Cinchona calisaya TaxID=153742 RepID=A0ABD2YXA2_9GENT
MENSRTIHQLWFLILLASCSLSIPSSQSKSFDHHLPLKPKAPLFVFGDSLYDPGNNNYINTTPDFQANFLPYGETFFEFATGRFSDGCLIPDFIAKYANLPLIPPYFQSSYHQFPLGVNFASGGGGALVETHEGKAIDLNKQLSYFKDVEKQLRRNLGNKETNQLLSNAVYMFSIGGNDLLAPNPIFKNFSSQEYIKIIVGNFTAVLKEVYKAGGRKFGLSACYLWVVYHILELTMRGVTVRRAWKTSRTRSSYTMQHFLKNSRSCRNSSTDLYTQNSICLQLSVKEFITHQNTVSRKQRVDVVVAGLTGELIPVEEKEEIQSTNCVIIRGSISSLILIIRLKESTCNSRS